MSVQEINVVGAAQVEVIHVQYIGKTDEYPDSLYGTGLWTKGQVKAVVASAALKMLAHPDQYIRACDEDVTVSPAASVAPVGENIDRRERDDSPEQAARDTISTMDRDALRAFITNNYRMPVDGRLSVASLREQAIRLVDQYGVTG